MSENDRKDLKRIFSGFYDSFRPDLANSMVISVKRYINSKSKYERQASKFVEDIRRKLFFIHDYNTQVAKISKYKYPRNRNFDMLLVQYLELEFDFLYGNPPILQKSLENAIERRVLMLLQVMLFRSVYNDDNLINYNSDRALKMEVLTIIAGVRSKYLAENRFLNNIAKKLILKINGGATAINPKNIDSYLKEHLFPDAHKNLATSDYGTDESDSDDKEMLQSTSFPKNDKEDDVFEVQVTENSLCPVPTIELLDDDSYMVYLARNPKNVCAKKRANCDSRYENNKKKKSDVVVICSDSEDDGDRDNNKNPSPSGVVTFEIVDDDDEDCNYMVYLQRETKSNTKPRVKKKRNKPSSSETEIIICSDSENDETDNKITDNTEETSDSQTFNHLVNIFPLESDVDLDLSANLIDQDSLIDPAFIFHDAARNPEDQFPFQISHITSLAPDGSIDDSPRIPGGPVLCERQDFEDANNLQECRLNDSLLEELILDNSYFDGRKEFDELESFLFDTSRGGVSQLNMGNLEDLLESPHFVHDSNNLESNKQKRSNFVNCSGSKRANVFDNEIDNVATKQTFSKIVNKRSKR